MRPLRFAALDSVMVVERSLSSKVLDLREERVHGRSVSPGMFLQRGGKWLLESNGTELKGGVGSRMMGLHWAASLLGSRKESSRGRLKISTNAFYCDLFCTHRQTRNIHTKRHL